MSNLSNLYISASYYGVVNLSDASEPFASQSEARIYLHDGVGESLGISLDSTKRVSIDNGLTITGSLLVSGSKILTGSLDVLGDITASGTVSAGTGSFDTINARKLNIIIESSSVIFSSGSNVLGDEDSDTQTFNGSVYVPHLHYLAGNAKDTNLRIDEKLSTSSFDSFSSSLHTEQLQQDQNLINVSESFAISQGVQDGRITALENFSSSLQADFVTDTELSAALQVVTSSLQSEIDTKLNISTFNSYTSSNNSIINSLIAETSSYAKLAGGNTFTGTQTINDTLYVNGTTQAFNGNLYSVNASTISFTGSMDLTGSFEITNNITVTGSGFFSGSVQGGVYNIIPVSNTASIDCSQGNFFTLNHATSNNYLLKAINITGGRTITLRVNKTNPDATISIDTGSIKFPFGFSYVISSGDEKDDVITFVSFDTGSLYAVSSKNFV